VPITYTSNEQIEVYRFSIPVAVGISAAALFFQAFLPRHFPFLAYFDLPFLVVVFFAIARRSQVTGLLTGAVIGLAQDALTSQPLGLYSLTKTVVGYGASSLGVKLDVENAGARFLVTLFFYLLHEVVYFTVARGMLKMNMHYTWQHELSSALLNAVLAVALFAVLDRFKQRT
jgi:rod shape-determining protein MreD